MADPVFLCGDCLKERQSSLLFLDVFHVEKLVLPALQEAVIKLIHERVVL